MRVSGTGLPFALDYGAVMSVGQALGADLDMLADVLPRADAAIVRRINADSDEGGSDE
ncbi:DUF7697 family protein [Sphingomonas sp. Leaf4]|uniref:DUF7697 family protein n=1 Tax=Sphingomonas sp. Leaf4 TaxID=2876553 RepID=UPI001E5A5D44|nr:hypothetical protein [Sphingomonas sp. Leaf4]